MHNKTVTPEQLENVQRAVLDLDLDPIKVKLMDEEGEGWTREYTDEVERWYRRFLFLNFKYQNQPIVVTKPIDTFWHYHILDTMKYAEDCQRAFGYFLHHFPYFGMRGEEDARDLQNAFDETLRIVEAEYGEPMISTVGSTWGDGGSPLPARSPEAPFKATKCSDCSGIISHGGADDGEHMFSHQRPSLA